MKRFLGGIAAALYVVACFLPSEPSGSERIEFQFDFAVPYRVPLAGTAAPTLTMTAGGQGLSNPRYHLESLDQGIVRVDPTGRGLEGLVRGTTSVRIVYQTSLATVDTVFPVQVVVSRIAVGPPSTNLTQLGAATPLSATAYDAKDATVPNVAFTWSSADSGIAAVNDTGLVRAIDEGTVAIIAEADSVKGLASITVTQVAAQVRLVPELDTLRTVGRSAQFFAIAVNDTGGVIRTARPRWTSSDTLVASVNEAGLATAQAGGTARIIARVGTAADSATLVVAQVVRSLVVTPAVDTLTAIADTVRVAALAFDSGGIEIPNPAVTWMTSDANVATVSPAGLVTAAANGVVLATASADGKSAFATIIVEQELTHIQISPDNVTLTGQGAGVQLSAVALDRNGYPVAGALFSWRSGSECVGTVDLAGFVTARGAGSTGIVASPLGGGPSDTATLSVTGAPRGEPTIAFESPRGIEAMCNEGPGSMVLIAGPVGEPAWSPEGTRLAFTRWSESGRCAINTARADGSEERKVTGGSGCTYSPAWSPDGTRIAFSSGDPVWGDHVGIAVIGANGPDTIGQALDIRRPWGVHRPWFTNPTWSPDGMKLAFEDLYYGDSDDGSSGIDAVNADGTGFVALIPGSGGEVDHGPPHYNFDPAWSPDGSYIAFARWDFATNQSGIWLMNSDGSGATNLTPGFSDARGPAWSPDGTQIVFVSYPNAPCGTPDPQCSFELHVINRDGTGLRRLTSSADYMSSPTWRPPSSSQATAQGSRR